MLKKLPDFVDPINAVSHDKQFVGSVNQARLPRLVEHLIDAKNEVEVDLQFYYDKGAKLPAAEMKVATTLNLQCQRSLEAFDFPVDHQVKVVFIEALALAEDLPEDLEVFELSDERISLLEWVEEELLLCVPMVPMSRDSHMPEFENDDLQQETPVEEEAKPNPFAALKALQK